MESNKPISRCLNIHYLFYLWAGIRMDQKYLSFAVAREVNGWINLQGGPIKIQLCSWGLDWKLRNLTTKPGPYMLSWDIFLPPCSYLTTPLTQESNYYTLKTELLDLGVLWVPALWGVQFLSVKVLVSLHVCISEVQNWTLKVWNQHFEWHQMNTLKFSHSQHT
jgi:hypothetical protein